MIQRIQSLYLLIVSILLIVAISSPLLTFTSIDQSSLRWEMFGVGLNQPEVEVTYIQTWPLFIVTLVSCILAAFSIFMFNHRMKQIRVTIFNTLLIMGYYGALAFYYFGVIKPHYSPVLTSWNWSVILPLIAIIFNWLAIRAIGADEALIRSVDRIRSTRKK